MDHQKISRGNQQIRIHTLLNLDKVIQKVSDMILESAITSIQERDIFRIVLTGGRTAKQLYTMLAHSVDNFNGWEFWFGDERNLPEEDPNRNSFMANESLFYHHGQQPFNPIPYDRDPTTAASVYQKQLEESNAIPFDLVLLSLGEDGHIASLFPHHPHNTQAKVISVKDAPKDPPTRVSLTAPTLSSCHNMVILATGAEKRDALTSWLHGDELPVMTLEPANGIDLFTDQNINVDL